jgi:hypothetical protein
MFKPSLKILSMSVELKTPPGEAIAERPPHWRRENFIPVRRAELVDLLAKQPGLSAAEQSDFRQFCRLVECLYHYEFHQELEDLKNAYAPFDPDADTQAVAAANPPAAERQLDGLFEKFVWLLQRANFVRLSQTDVAAAAEAASDWGLQLSVDFDLFERLEVFARGDVVGRRERRRWRNLMRREQVDVPIYQRLVIICRMRDGRHLDSRSSPHHVYIKTFKNIPKIDLDMLLPGSRVKMSLFDRGKIILPTVSGLAITGWKLFQGAVVVAVAGVYGLLTFLGLLAGTLGYGVKSFFGYLRTQQKYQLNLTRSLYYQNLDNNAGVLFRLLDEAEEQECREAFLAYYFLWRHTSAEGWTSERLDGEIESFLEREIDVKIDFEVGDALAKLRRLQLIEESTPGCWRAMPIERALAALDRCWDDLFCHAPAASRDANAA